MQKKKTIEQKASETILQTPQEITVGGFKYKVAPPTTATLIMASEAISQLPAIRMDAENLTEEVLSAARDCRALGEVAATLILGAKDAICTVEIRQKEKVPVLGGLFHRTRTVVRKETVDRRKELGRELLEELSPSELHSLTARLLGSLQLSDFFALTTFLTEVNLLRQTKVETGATASGR